MGERPVDGGLCGRSARLLVAKDVHDRASGAPFPPQNAVRLEAPTDLIDLLVRFDPRPHTQVRVGERSPSLQCRNDPIGVRHSPPGSNVAVQHQVWSPRDHATVVLPGTYREVDGSPVAFAEAKRLWSAAARPALERVARSYGSYTTYKELAEEVQQRAGVRSRMLMRYWIGHVLGAVSRSCHEQGEPLLSALCVDAEGCVGAGYEGAVIEAYGAAPEDLQMHAARERLLCHQFFGAVLPVGGGTPTLTPQVAARRRATSQRSESKPAVCPSCHIALPATGQCDFCA
jgi:hypothetical protein